MYLVLFILTLSPRVALALYTYGQGNIDIQRYNSVGAYVLNGGVGYDLGMIYYPYPPLWMYVEATGVLLSKLWGVAFDFLIKLPIIIADSMTALLVCSTLLHLGLRRNRAFIWSLAFALNPISIMVSGGHGQFDSIVILACCCTLYLLTCCKLQPTVITLASLALGVGIALKFYPVLFVLPYVCYLRKKRMSAKHLATFFLLSFVPLGLSLFPFIPGKLSAIVYPILYPMSREISDFGLGKIMSYSGMSNSFGFIGLRILFVFIYISFVTKITVSSEKLVATIIAMLACFYASSPSLSAQYFVWILPFAVIGRNYIMASLYSLVGSFALLSFYLFAHPATLLGARAFDIDAASEHIIGAVWLISNALLWIVCVVWAFSFLKIIGTSGKEVTRSLQFYG
jgi:hypothetical protein